MKLAKSFCLWAITLTVVVRVSTYAQGGDAIGMGASFGTSTPQSDVAGAKNEPFTRLFFRYFPQRTFGIEAGAGLGILSAERNQDFFSSIFNPIDFRVILQPPLQGKIQPYVFGGLGMMYFDPQDRVDAALPRNSRNEYSQVASFLPVGAGAQYFIERSTAIEFSATYHYAMTENLDDIKGGSNDSYLTLAVNLFAFIKSGTSDSDGDGLSDDEEKQLGTLVNGADSDGDGLRDGEEARTYRTNPRSADSDGEGLNDRDEIFTYRTNPLIKDTDGDGLTDFDELTKYSTDPMKGDTDGDGLTDSDEVMIYHTDPLKADTDGDGLRDSDEVLRYRTDPMKIDTDGDGLTDGDELLKYKTNPLNADTDEGGMPDGKEVQLGLNPLRTSDDLGVPGTGGRVILQGVNFISGKSLLTPEAKKVLEPVAQSLLAYPDAVVEIQGHTDNVGNARMNLNLSNARAEMVKAYLVSRGVAPSRMSTRGFGYTRPIADNASDEGRAKNRRIEFVRVK